MAACKSVFEPACHFGPQVQTVREGLAHSHIRATELIKAWRTTPTEPTPEEIDEPGFDPETDAQKRWTQMIVDDYQREQALERALFSKENPVTSDNYIVTLFHPHTCTTVAERRKLRAEQRRKVDDKVSAACAHSF